LETVNDYLHKLSDFAPFDDLYEYCECKKTCVKYATFKTHSKLVQYVKKDCEQYLLRLKKSGIYDQYYISLKQMYDKTFSNYNVSLEQINEFVEFMYDDEDADDEEQITLY
jgi:hypothetical protein